VTYFVRGAYPFIHLGFNETETPVRPSVLRRFEPQLLIHRLSIMIDVFCNGLTIVNWEKGRTDPRLNQLPGII
jgi:hypothetical protein